MFPLLVCRGIHWGLKDSNNWKLLLKRLILVHFVYQEYEEYSKKNKARRIIQEYHYKSVEFFFKFIRTYYLTVFYRLKRIYLFLCIEKHSFETCVLILVLIWNASIFVLDGKIDLFVTFSAFCQTYVLTIRSPTLVYIYIYVYYYFDSELCWRNYCAMLNRIIMTLECFWVSKECIGIVVFCKRDYISRIWIRSILMAFCETTNCTDESLRDETCLQLKMKKHYIKTWKI